MAIFSKQNQAGSPKNLTPRQASRVPSPRYRKRYHKLIYSTYFRIILSAILIFLLFVTAFLIAYQSETRKKANEDFEKAIPDAEILLPTPEITSIPAIDTSSWNTYSNEEYSFEVRYPKDYFIETNPSDQTSIVKISNSSLFEEDELALVITVRSIDDNDVSSSDDSRLIEILNRDLYFDNLIKQYGSNVKGNFLGDPPWGYYYIFIPFPAQSTRGLSFKVRIHGIDDLSSQEGGTSGLLTKTAQQILSTFQFLEE